MRISSRTKARGASVVASIIAAVAAGTTIGAQSASALPGLDPNAAITANPNPAFVNQTVNFDASGSTGDGSGIGGAIASYEWDLDGNGSFETNTGLTPSTSSIYPTPGTVNVSVRVTDSENDFDDASVALIVHRPPVADFTVTPPVPQPGQTITFDGSSSNDPDGPIAPADHDWDLDNDGQFDDAQGPVIAHSFATAGSYTVRLRVTDSNDATDIDTKVVRVNAAPLASFIFQPSTPGVNESVTFSSTSSDPDGALAGGSLKWDFDNDGQFDDAVGASVSHIFTSPGTPTIKLEVTDADGVTAVASRDVLVQANPPNATFTVSPLTPKTGETVSFDASASTAPPGETITSIAWDLDGDGQFDDAVGPVTSTAYTSAGPRAVSLRVDVSGGGFDIASAIVTVDNRGPTASFTVAPNIPRVGDTIELTSTSNDPDGPITEQTWDFDNDGEFDDAAGTSATTAFTEPGSYPVGLRVVDANGDSDVVEATIKVRGKVLALLSPFPIVRLAGSVGSGGKTAIDRLSISAPRDSKVTVKCAGRACPFHRQAHTVERNRVRFPAMERKFGPHTVIRVFVSREDRIGKFTRFDLRRTKAPQRIDRCVSGEKLHPVSCPRS